MTIWGMSRTRHFRLRWQLQPAPSRSTGTRSSPGEKTPTGSAPALLINIIEILSQELPFFLGRRNGFRELIVRVEKNYESTCLDLREVCVRPSRKRRCRRGLRVVVDEVRRELAVHGTGADCKDPRRDVGDGTEAGAGVAGGADDGDAAADGVEGPDGDAVVEVVAGLAAKGERQHVHAVVDGGVKRGQDVRVEAPAAVHGRVAHAVRRHARAGGAADGRAVAEPEH
jgi:hypothetical protein